MQRGVHGVSEDGGNDDEIGSTDAQFLEQNLMTSLAQFEHEVIGGQQGLRFTKLLAQVMSHRLMKLIGGNGERRHPLGFLIWRGRRHVVAVALLAACRGLVCRVGPTVVPVELAHPRALERVWAQTADNLTALTLLKLIALAGTDPSLDEAQMRKALKQLD